MIGSEDQDGSDITELLEIFRIMQYRIEDLILWNLLNDGQGRYELLYKN